MNVRIRKIFLILLMAVGSAFFLYSGFATLFWESEQDISKSK